MWLYCVRVNCAVLAGIICWCGHLFRVQVMIHLVYQDYSLTYKTTPKVEYTCERYKRIVKCTETLLSIHKTLHVACG